MLAFLLALDGPSAGDCALERESCDWLRGVLGGVGLPCRRARSVSPLILLAGRVGRINAREDFAAEEVCVADDLCREGTVFISGFDMCGASTFGVVVMLSRTFARLASCMLFRKEDGGLCNATDPVRETG